MIPLVNISNEEFELLTRSKSIRVKHVQTLVDSDLKVGQIVQVINRLTNRSRLGKIIEKVFLETLPKEVGLYQYELEIMKATLSDYKIS